MKIYYQWYEWAYSHEVAIKIADYYKIDKKKIYGLFSFKDIFNKLSKENCIWIIPIENSYAGSVHENFYHLAKSNIKIIWEYYQDINHCLLWIWKDKSKIKKAYSHYQALMQCESYLKKNNIKPVIWADTAWSAKYVKEQNNPEFWAIASEFAGKIYWLNILEKDIQDQKWNTTRFFIVVPKKLKIKKFSKSKKVSLIFKVKDKPATLYKCLGAFATNNINLTKIESIPTQNKKFEYMFWVDFIYENSLQKLEEIIKELKYFAKEVKILWKY